MDFENRQKPENFLKRLDDELAHQRKEDLFREIQIYNSCRINFSHNDYFQLRKHPDVISSAERAIREFGTGSGASPLLSGYLPCHDQLLTQLLEWKKKASGVLFNTGFMANQAVLKHLPGKNDLILTDRLIHHSIAQVLSSGNIRFKRYDHLDLDQLEDLLKANQNKFETIFVVTESVFSMDGDYPDLKILAQLKSKYNFVFILDEAHGTGPFGPTGGGLAEEMEVLDQVDILVGTLGKALAGMGAYVLTNTKTITDYLTNFAGELIYSTFLTPAVAGASSAAIEIIKKSADTRKILKENACWLRGELKNAGWKTNDFDSQIVPVLIGDSNKVMEIKNGLMDKGILVGAVRPPTVPKDTARLRLSLHAGITRDDLKDLLTALNNWKSL